MAKDPLDREKPWGVPGLLLLIAIPVCIVVLMIRLAVVVPEWGWQALVPGTATAVAVYYFIAFRTGLSRKPGFKRPKQVPRQVALGAVVLVLIAAMLTVPIWAAVFYVRNGALPWD